MCKLSRWILVSINMHNVTALIYRQFWKLEMWKASNDFYCRLSNNRLLSVWNVTPYIPLHQISDTATHLRMQMPCKLVYLIPQLPNLIMSRSTQLNELKMSNYWWSLAIATAWKMSSTYCISYYYMYFHLLLSCIVHFSNCNLWLPHTLYQ